MKCLLHAGVGVVLTIAGGSACDSAVVATPGSGAVEGVSQPKPEGMFALADLERFTANSQHVVRQNGCGSVVINLFGPIRSVGGSRRLIDVAFTFPELDVAPAMSIEWVDCNASSEVHVISGVVHLIVRPSGDLVWGQVESESDLRIEGF